jgi:hypothetical protein
MRHVCAVLAIVMVAACGNPPAADTTTSITNGGPVVTAITSEFESTWTPAWAPPSDLRAEFEAALRASGIWVLAPTEATLAASSLAADVRITGTMPTSQSGVAIVLRRADQSVFISLQTAPIGTQPACETRLDDLGYPLWATQVVRGTTGCSLLVEGAVSSLDWFEDGQFFHTEFGPEIDVGELALWLDTWLPVGSG